MKRYLFLIFNFFLVVTLTFSLVTAFNFETNTVRVTASTSTVTYTGNLTNFTELQDTPSTYSGNANKCLIVNVGETALGFGDCGVGGGVSWANIINGTMATWQQVMNGTVSGGGITWNTAANGTLALNSSLATYSSSINEPRWADNFSKYNTTWSSTYNVTYAGYNSTGLIKDWNNTGLIKDWNGTGLIINWSTGGQVELDPKAYNGTLAYNTSLALYYPLGNPYAYFNSTSPPTIALDDLTDVVIPTPENGEVLQFNGASWINTLLSIPTSAGTSFTYYLTDNASDISNYEELNITPAGSPEIIETVTVNNNQTLIDPYATDSGGLGTLLIDGGIWEFDTYANVSQTTGVSEILIDVYKRNSTGTEVLLFSTTTGQINSLTPALYSPVSIQQSFTFNLTDRLVVKYTAKTTAIIDTTISLFHGGTDRYTHFHVPLFPDHNNLPGLQGGASTQYYHLTLAEYQNISYLRNQSTSSGAEVDPYWTSNFTLYNATWSSAGVESDPKAYNGTLAYNTSLGLYYPLVNPYNYWNDTFALFNKTYADTLYAPVSEPKAYNGTLVTVTVDTATNTSLYNWIVAQSYTAGASTWVQAMNGTLAKTTDLSAYSTWVQAMNGTLAKATDLSAYYLLTNPYSYYNSTIFDYNNYYLKSNPYSYYNATNPQTEADPKAYNGTLAYNTSLATYSASVTWGYNMTTPAITYANASYLKLTGGNMTGNINMSSYNITLNNGTTNGRLCLTQTCNSYIYNNGTGVVIQG